MRRPSGARPAARACGPGAAPAACVNIVVARLLAVGCAFALAQPFRYSWLTSPLCIVCGTRSRGSCSPGDRLWLRGPVLRGHFGLARTPTRALARHDRAADQQLATPDTPGLPALERTGQAGQPGLTAPAHRLGGLHVLGRLGEELLRVLRVRKILAHRDPVGRASHRHDADLIEYLPDVWLLPCRH